jgi:hypothetical protein
MEFHMDDLQTKVDKLLWTMCKMCKKRQNGGLWKKRMDPRKYPLNVDLPLAEEVETQ